MPTGSALVGEGEKKRKLQFRRRNIDRILPEGEWPYRADGKRRTEVQEEVSRK